MWRLKYRPTVTDGRMVIVLTDGHRDFVYERTKDFPLGTWGVVELPVIRKRRTPKRQM